MALLPLFFLFSFTLAQRFQPAYDQAVLDLKAQSGALLLNVTLIRERYLSWPSAPIPYLNCSTATLEMDDTASYKYPVSCSLAAQPNSTVTIFLEAYGMTFDTCYIEFNSSNWQTAMTFNVIPSLQLFKTQAAQTNPIYMLAFTETETYNNQTFVLPVSKSTRAAATCTITGDPHITGFTQAPTYSYQGSGKYSLVESTAGLRILGSYAPCNGGSVTCISGIQVQYNNATYVVSFVQATSAQNILINNIGTSASGTNAVVSADTRTVIITLEDSSVISLFVHFNGGNGGSIPPFNYMDFSVTLSSHHYQKTSGHCGVWDDLADSSLLYCKGQSWPRTTGINQFGDCWTTANFGINAPLTSNIVLSTVPQLCQIPPLALVMEAPACPDFAPISAGSSAPAYVTGYLAPSSENVDQATGYSSSSGFVAGASGYSSSSGYVAQATGYSSSSGYVAGATGYSAPQETVAGASGYSSPIQAPVACNITSTAALDMCTRSIEQVPGCESLCALTTYISNCVSDVMLSCAIDYCATTRNSYVQSCSIMAGLLVNDPSVTVAALGLSVQKVVGCPPKNSTDNINTVVNFSVKRCDAGWSGLNCDVNIANTYIANPMVTFQKIQSAVKSVPAAQAIVPILDTPVNKLATQPAVAFNYAQPIYNLKSQIHGASSGSILLSIGASVIIVAVLSIMR